MRHNNTDTDDDDDDDDDVSVKPRHKYLYSDVATTWAEAREQCALYGGWLVTIGSLEEQNCLVRYGRSQGYDNWYYIDGE